MKLGFGLASGVVATIGFTAVSAVTLAAPPVLPTIAAGVALGSAVMIYVGHSLEQNTNPGDPLNNAARNLKGLGALLLGACLLASAVGASVAFGTAVAGAATTAGYAGAVANNIGAVAGILAGGVVAGGAVFGVKSIFKKDAPSNNHEARRDVQSGKEREVVGNNRQIDKKSGKPSARPGSPRANTLGASRRVGGAMR